MEIMHTKILGSFEENEPQSHIDKMIRDGWTIQHYSMSVTCESNDKNYYFHGFIWQRV